MNKPSLDIDKLRVASPCSADWDAMAGDARRRFCDSCRLNVYNFSEMTPDEIRRLVTGSEGRICATLYKRADGTVITKDCPVGFRTYQKRALRFAGAALTAVLGLFSVSYGQKTDEKTADEPKVKIVRTVSSENVVTGTIFDAAEARIVTAGLNLRKGKNVIASTGVNDEGDFSFSSLAAGKYSLQITAPGFQSRTIDLEVNEYEPSRVEMTVELNVGSMGGLIYITEPDSTKENIESPAIDPLNKKPEKPR